MAEPDSQTPTTRVGQESGDVKRQSSHTLAPQIFPRRVLLIGWEAPIFLSTDWEFPVPSSAKVPRPEYNLNIVRK